MSSRELRRNRLGSQPVVGSVHGSQFSKIGDPPDKAMPERFSRHYCDFYDLIRKGVSKSATAKPDLLAQVAEHKALFFKSSWARYGEAASGTLRVAPPEHRLKALREDYAKMLQMFFGEPPYLSDVLRRPPAMNLTQIAQLLPGRWKAQPPDPG